MLSVSSAAVGGAAIKLDGWDVIAEQTREEGREGCFVLCSPPVRPLKFALQHIKWAARAVRRK